MKKKEKSVLQVNWEVMILVRDAEIAAGWPKDHGKKCRITA